MIPEKEIRLIPSHRQKPNPESFQVQKIMTREIFGGGADIYTAKPNTSVQATDSLEGFWLA